MKRISRTRQFKKDARRMDKRGKALDKLREAIEALAAGAGLEARFRDHALTGQYAGVRECHIEPDWLLVYEATEEEVILIRTGSHSDLFR